MEFWHAISYAPPEQCVGIATAAEQAGFTGLALPDHLLTPLRVESRYPYRVDGEIFWDPTAPFPDPWVLAGVLAQATLRLRFMTYVYVLPLRDPFSAAKAISTAAVLSGDRVVLGAGVGWMEDEFRAVGQGFADRGRRTDDILVLLRKLLAGGPVEHRSEFFDLPPVQLSPVPKRPVPIWIGGHSDAALRRAAGCDGVNYDDAEIDAILRRLARFRAESGRANAPFEVVLAPNATPTPELCRRLADRGVTGIVVPTWLARGEEPSTLEHKAASLRRLGDEVIAKV